MELRCLTAAFFVNTNDALDLPRPTTSLIHHIGGIAIREPKELDKVLILIVKRKKNKLGFQKNVAWFSYHDFWS
jgi:hypothetical protein